jgi:hypothetical protein
MKTNDKILRLVKHGLKATNLTKLNESQINGLYTRLVEQSTVKVTNKNVKQYEVPDNTTANVAGMEVSTKGGKTVITQTNEGEITEKSVSKQQQKLMGLALSVKKGDTPKSKVSKSVKDMAKKMSKSDLEDFASTKHKGLPNKVEAKEENKYDLGKALTNAYSKGIEGAATKVVPSIASFGESELEKEITRLVERHLSPKMTKKDFMNIIENNVIISRDINEESDEETGLPSWLRWENITKK